MIGSSDFYDRRPASEMHYIRGERVKTNNPETDDPHKKVFYLNAAKEYEICSKCPYPYCVTGCTPKKMKKAMDRDEKIKQLADTGMVDAEIAKKVGCSKSTAQKVRHKLRTKLEDPCSTCWTGKRGLCHSGTCQSKRNYERSVK